jgi:hypothetical protein
VRARGLRPWPEPERAERFAPGAARPVAVTILVLALIATACGLRADEQPQPIPRNRLDNRLFEESSDATAGQRARIYVITSVDSTPRLTPVSAPVPPSLPYVRAVIEALLIWTPSDRSGDQGLSSRIPYGAGLNGIRQDSDVLTVDLSNFTIEGAGQTQAFAQILFTATEIPGINSVRFVVDGRPVGVLLNEGSSDPGARLRRQDFPSLAPLPQTTTTRRPTTTTTAVAPEPAAPAG